MNRLALEEDRQRTEDWINSGQWKKDFEEHIRRFAYVLWEEYGKPSGKDNELKFWFMAESFYNPYNMFNHGI